MEGAKFVLLHIQLVNILLDASMNSLITPVIYMPTPIVSLHGILPWLGIPYKVLIYIAQFSVFLIGMSIVALFQNRHSAIQSIPYRLQKKSTKFIYYSVSYLCGAIALVFVFLDDVDDNQLKLKYLEWYPCPPPEYFQSIASVFTNSIEITEMCLAASIIFMTSNVSFFVSSSVYYLVIAPSKNTSKKTREIQLRFLIMLSIQITIPFLVLLIPTALIVYMFITKTNSQKINNFTVILFATHGILSNCALIFTHKPYRENTLRIFKIEKEVTSIVVK
ncbi:unnamed protein product [Caenorhabditis angaria]|uniref:Serpentine Receptor, class H n=1 Tax=Caenorhabditis angaria TaxID=860376 RepID=A0A9P1N213_9PELO|nr:unnamed protein product [Caenorhabditis angaria]